MPQNSGMRPSHARPDRDSHRRGPTRAAVLLLGVVAASFACRAPHLTRLSVEARATLEGAGSMQIFALDPWRHTPAEESTKPDAEKFHGYRILGEATVDNPETRSRIVRLVYDGIDGNTTTAAGCFDPRHGIRATLDGRSIDLVICFECLQLKLYDSGAEDGSGGMTTSRSPEPEMTRIFNELGLTIEGQDDR